MSRKLITLAYIYEMQGKYKEAIAFYEHILNADVSKNLSVEMIYEARFSIRVCQSLLAKQDERRGKMSDLDDKIEDFIRLEDSIKRWLSVWN